jgi:hypothetical protein
MPNDMQNLSNQKLKVTFFLSLKKNSITYNFRYVKEPVLAAPPVIEAVKSADKVAGN